MLNGTCTPRKYTGAGSVTDNVGCKRYNSVSRCPFAKEGTGSFPIAVADGAAAICADSTISIGPGPYRVASPVFERQSVAFLDSASRPGICRLFNVIRYIGAPTSGTITRA